MYAYFNIIHIMYLFLPVVMLVCFYNIFKNKSHKAQTIFLLCCMAVSACICFYDMFCLIPVGGWKTIFRNLPLFPCDLNNFILPYAILKKKKRPVLDKYIAYFSTVGALSTVLAPVAESNTFYFYEYEIWGPFLAHSIYFTVAVLYLKFNHVEISSKAPWKPLAVLLAMMTVAHGVNLALIYSGLNPNANYFFTARPAEVGIAYRCSVMLGYNIPWIRCYFFMMVGYVGWTIMAYFVHKILETETCARLWAKTKTAFKKLFTVKPKNQSTSV